MSISRYEPTLFGSQVNPENVERQRERALEPPPEVFSTNDLPNVSIQQDGKIKGLLWRKKKRGRRR